MEQLILVATLHDDFAKVNTCFLDGWILNPFIADGKPVRLDTSVVYHLVKLSDAELGALPSEEASPVPRDITSIISVPINDADAKIAAGYQVYATYAKSVTLVTYRAPSISGVEPT